MVLVFCCCLQLFKQFRGNAPGRQQLDIRRCTILFFYLPLAIRPQLIVEVAGAHVENPDAEVKPGDDQAGAVVSAAGKGHHRRTDDGAEDQRHGSQHECRDHRTEAFQAVQPGRAQDQGQH